MREYIDLLETYEYVLLETPQRAAWLVSNFGAKLEEKFRLEDEAHQIADVIKQQIENQEPEDHAAKIVAYIMAADPTPSKAYSRWIALRLVKGGRIRDAEGVHNFPPERFEDVNQNLRNMLATFQRASQARRIEANIDAIQSFSSLFAVLEPFITGDREVSGRADRVAKRDTKVDSRVRRQWDVDDPMRARADVLYDGPDYMVLIPKDAAAATYFGTNTNWCTTTNMFDYYNDKGPLFIILRRSDSRRWQFHFESQQFMDERDHSININKFIDENPKVFQVLGAQRFVAVIDKLSPPISLRHFDAATIGNQPDEVLASSIQAFDDLSYLPQDRINTKEFFSLLVPRMSPNQYHHIQESDAKKIINHYAEILKDPTYFAAECTFHTWLLSYLPRRLQTDKAKENVANRLVGWNVFEKAIPKPWPESVENIYWSSRTKSQFSLHADDIPEEFRSDENLAIVLSRHADDISKYRNRLSEEFCEKMVVQVIDSPNFVFHVLNNIPEKFRTKTLWKLIYERAKDIKTKSMSHVRDAYLIALTRFPLEYWPWRAPNMSNRMAVVNPDFFKNPEQFQNKHHAALWAAYHPDELNDLPDEFITPAVIESALMGADRGNDLDASTRLHVVLSKADPDVVKPEWVAPVIKKMGNISDFWDMIPEKYLDQSMIDVLLSKGDIPFDDPVFPKDGFTPDNVLARFKKAVKPKVKDPNKKDTYDYLNRPIDNKVYNFDGMKDEWSEIPSNVNRKDILISLIRGGYMGIPLVVEKELLDSDVLYAWVESFEPYSEDKVNWEKVFKAFPEQSYTSSNMAVAVKKKIINKVPEHLRDDDVLVNMMRDWSSKQNINWGRVTSDVFKKLISTDAYDAANAMRFSVPKNHPIMSDPSVAEMLLRKPKGELEVNDSMIAAIYGEHPQRRAKWGQACFDLAAGNIVPLKDIPEQFRSVAAILRAVRTDPKSVLVMEKPAEWLNEHAGDKIPPGTLAGLLAYGIAKTSDGYRDMRDSKRVTVDGVAGSYSFVKLQPKGEALMIFDDNNHCVDTLLTSDVEQSVRNSWSIEMFASKLNDRDIPEPEKKLAPYRLLIADAAQKNPQFITMLPLSYHSGINSLKNIMLFRDENGKLLPIEKFPRKKISDSNLTYAFPGNSWRETKFYLFDGNGPLVGEISLTEDGRGVTFNEFKASDESTERLIGLSKGLAHFLAVQGVASGNNAKFKSSDLYTKLGIRGPGSYEWFSLLDEKIMDLNDLSVWKHDNRFSIVHVEHGILAVGKKVKGGFAKEFSTGSHKFISQLNKVFDAMVGKV